MGTEAVIVVATLAACRLDTPRARTYIDDAYIGQTN
jgi:hypothetical protein